MLKYLARKSFSSNVQKRVLVAIANGSEELECVSIVDILRRTQSTEVVLAKIDRNQSDSSNSLMNIMSRGIKIEADVLFDQKVADDKSFDAIVLPGGLDGAKAFQKSSLLVQTVERYMDNDQKIVGAICASPAVVLQFHGLLFKYDQVTAYPAFKDKIDSSKWSDDAVVRSKNLITSQGPGTSIPFSIALINALFDKKKAREVYDPLIFSNESFDSYIS